MDPLPTLPVPKPQSRAAKPLALRLPSSLPEARGAAESRIQGIRWFGGQLRKRASLCQKQPLQDIVPAWHQLRLFARLASRPEGRRLRARWDFKAVARAEPQHGGGLPAASRSRAKSVGEMPLPASLPPFRSQSGMQVASWRRLLLKQTL